MTKRIAWTRIVLLASAALAACVAPTHPEPISQAAAPPPPPPLNTTGLEGVIGRTARALEKEFGRPQLDVQEGNARKLQFASDRCILDTYLYPPARGEEAVVTYIDARLPDGRDVNRASCVAALQEAAESRGR